MPKQRKNYSAVLFDSQERQIGIITFDDKGIPTKRRYPFSKTKSFEIYYGNTYKTGFDLDGYSTFDTKSFIIGATSTLNSKREKSRVAKKQNKNIKDLLSFNYRLYGEDRKVISKTNFRAAHWFAIFDGRKKIHVGDFKDVSGREAKINKMRLWRADRPKDKKPEPCPDYDYEVKLKDIASPRVEPLPYQMRKRTGTFKAPIDVPEDIQSMSDVFDSVRKCLKREFINELKTSGGSTNRYLFKVAVDFYDPIGQKLFRNKDRFTDQPKLLKDQDKHSMHYSSVREVLTSPHQFDLAFDDLKRDFMLDMKSYIRRAAAMGFKITGFEVENIIGYYH
jgi:hypothetical protein